MTITVTHLCNQLVDIVRLTNTYTEEGDISITPTTALTDIKVAISVKSGTTKIEEIGMLEEFTHKMMSDTELLQGDIVKYGTTNYKIIRKYDVWGLKSHSHWEYLLLEIPIT